jgi:glycerophosphoryl diester phosphodiesterase
MRFIAVFVFATFSGLFPPLHAERSPKIIAHRGAMIERPENTMSAFKRAVEAGADVVEVDVRASRDGRLFILHDSHLDRTTNGQGSASNLTLAELQQLDAGSHFNASHKNEKIPSLEEVLRWGQDQTLLLLDLKEHSRPFNETVAAEVKKYGDPSRVVLGVRTPDQARHLRQLLPETYQLAFMRTSDLVEAFAETGVNYMRLWLPWAEQDPSLAQRVRQSGARLMINGTTGNQEEARRILAFSPDWILVDDPAQLRQSLQTLALESAAFP